MWFKTSSETHRYDINTAPVRLTLLLLLSDDLPPLGSLVVRGDEEHETLEDIKRGFNVDCLTAHSCCGVPLPTSRGQQTPKLEVMEEDIPIDVLQGLKTFEYLSLRARRSRHKHLLHALVL